MISFDFLKWQDPSRLPSWSYMCGWCGVYVNSTAGWALLSGNAAMGGLYICSNCQHPTLLNGPHQSPGPTVGQEVRHLPEDVEALYREARRAITSDCYTAAVMLCRKILMHVAVAEGAKEGLSFLAYVDYLDSSGIIPKSGKGWIDHIRTKGNEANHEIVMMDREEATRLLQFIQMLLKLTFEFPSSVPGTATTKAP